MTPPVPCLSVALGDFPAIMSSSVTPETEVVEIEELDDVMGAVDVVVEEDELVMLEEELDG
ncbi:MAG: hypothetical protein LYZ69_06600 [Nitrososphaerales archaeon]|nr:hypothetical protein [Nitrososphaerales archaeon]